MLARIRYVLAMALEVVVRQNPSVQRAASAIPTGAAEWAGTLLVGDPSPVYLLGASRIGQQANVEVLTASSPAALRSLVRDRPGGVLLANPALWAVEGWRRLHDLHVLNQHLAVGALVDRSRRWEMERAIQAGYRAYLDKRLFTPELLPATISSLLAGGAVYLSGPRPDAPAVPARELEVLAQLGEGQTVQAIAQRLFLSQRTIKATITSVTRRLGAGNRVQAVALGYRYGLLPVAEPGAGRIPHQ